MLLVLLHYDSCQYDVGDRTIMTVHAAVTKSLSLHLSISMSVSISISVSVSIGIVGLGLSSSCPPF